MTVTEDIPSLTLKVLENIQAELVGMRGEIVGMRGDVQSLNTRFDHLLGFVGRDVQNLKDRLTAVEHHLGFAKP